MLRMVLVGDNVLVARFKSVSDKVRTRLNTAVQEQLYSLQSYIVSSKLSGQVLKRRTGNLASSINVRMNSGNPDDISGQVGTAVVYAAIHEYGGTVTIPAHQRTITQAFGRPLKDGSKQIDVRSYQATFPERSFLRSGLQDRQAQIRTAINSAVNGTMKELTHAGK